MSTEESKSTGSETGDREALERIDRLFQQARRLSGRRREVFLAEACADDPAIRDEVESLLSHVSAHEGRDDGFLSEPALGPPIELDAITPRDDPPLPAPQQIGRYTIVRKLGEGGMGVVYLAEQEATMRRVALKVIHGFARSAALTRRFEHEARVLGRLRHGGIAQVYEAGVHEIEPGGPLPFIAMELVEGVPIVEYAARQRLSVNQRLDLMIQACEAVHHAHEHGVIHRDLKPANILVADSDAAVKIIDFGIACVTDADAHTTMHTRTGQLIGTLQYMSPEQVTGGPATVDTRADVYALGVILYELLAGKPPLDLTAHTMLDAVRIIRDDDPAPLSTVNRRYRGDLTTIVGKALEKERERRYQSARELADDLARFLRDQPIIAHRPSATYQIRKFARRNRALVASLLTIALVMAAATVISTRQAIRATAAQQRAQQQHQRAEEHLADAHHLARTMIFDIDTTLAHLAGALPARQLLVERGLAYLDKLAQQAGDDPDLLWELATGYIVIGDVQGDTQRPNIGDLDGAMESYRAAADILEQHIERMPPRASETHFLALAKIGDQLQMRNDHAGSLEYFLRALDIARKAAARNDQAKAHLRVAGALSALGRNEEAGEHVGEAQRIMDELLAENPEHLGYKRDVAVRHFDRGLHLLKGDPATALREFEAFVAICESLAQVDPQDAVYQRDIAIGVQRMGHALEAMGRADDALPLYERELAIMEQLAAADPENYQARTGVVAPCCKIGEAYLAKGDLQTSLAYFQQYLETARACAEANPADAAMQREVGVAYYKMNQWHAQQASNETLDADERLMHWREVCSRLEQCHDHFIMMRETGLLRPVDAGVPEVIAAELAQCQAKTPVGMGDGGR